MKLIFESPSINWEESTPIGNGYLGAMVMGDPNHDILYMNEDSLYSGPKLNRLNDGAKEHIETIRNLLLDNKIDEAHKMAELHLFPKSPHPRHYEPLGQVHIVNNDKDNSEFKDYEKTLDLEDGLLSINYSNKEKVKKTIFSSNKENIVSYSIESEEPNLSFEIYMTRRSPTSGQSESFLDELVIEDKILLLSGYNGNKNKGIDFTMGLSIQECDGNIEYFDSRIQVSNASKLTININGRTSYRSSNPKNWCKSNLLRIDSSSNKDILENHIKDYQKLFNSSSLRLSTSTNLLKLPEAIDNIKEGKYTNEIFQAYFEFSKYLLISSSREGSLPSNLQGIWSKDFTPPWGSRYTININTEMNYWLPEKLNMLELSYPLFEFLLNNLDSASFVADKMYGSKGAVIHHNTDIFGDAAPSDFYMPATIWPMGGIWLSTHILSHFEYTKDYEFLDKYFIVIFKNYQFIKDYLFEHNGQLNTGPSVSPENTYITEDGQLGQLCISPSMDIQIIREFLNETIKLPDTYVDEHMKQDILNIINKLPPIKINDDGKIMEWDQDFKEYEPGHRHISHLYGLHPGHQITPSSKTELKVAAKKTLDSRIANGGGHTGWSCAWIINFYARLEDSINSFENLVKLLSESTLGNLLDNHPPFQIDGNFGGANGMLEMIVQDYSDTVYLLRALPDQFRDGELENIKLKSGCNLNMRWENSKIISLSIKGIRDGIINLKSPDLEKEIKFRKDERIIII